MTDTELEIGEVARRAGLRASAVRYYESRGLVAPERRRGGRRVYGAEAVERLALIAFAKDLGFSLDDIRTLLFSFPEATPPGERWSGLAEVKLAELDALAERIERMRGALRHVAGCRCGDLGQCAKAIAAKRC
jgi:MerR family redox-sensitive transcriptional activator SoxR